MSEYYFDGGYSDCLELAGAKVFKIKRIGSYSGVFIALVQFEGKIGYVRDYFGSCSSCDSLESSRYKSEEKIKSLGLSLLSDIKTYEEALSAAEGYDEEVLVIKRFQKEYLEEAGNK